MRMPLLLSLPFVAIPLLGCQSYEAGVRVICEAPTSCPECAQAPPDQRLTVLARRIDEELSNGEAKSLFEALAYAAPEEKSAILRREAASAGITECPMADVLGSGEAGSGPDAP